MNGKKAKALRRDARVMSIGLPWDRPRKAGHAVYGRHRDGRQVPVCMHAMKRDQDTKETTRHTVTGKGVYRLLKRRMRGASDFYLSINQSRG